MDSKEICCSDYIFCVPIHVWLPECVTLESCGQVLASSGAFGQCELVLDQLMDRLETEMRSEMR